MGILPDASSFGLGSWTIAAAVVVGTILVVLFASTLFTVVIWLGLALFVGVIAWLVGARLKRWFIEGSSTTTVDSSGGGDE